MRVLEIDRAFGQGKEVYRFLLNRIQSGPQYLLAGVYPTTRYVAVARPRTPEGLELLLSILENDLRLSLADGWISMEEFSARKEKLLVNTNCRDLLICRLRSCGQAEGYKHPELIGEHCCRADSIGAPYFLRLFSRSCGLLSLGTSGW